jgi:hypothetical protein
MSWAALASNPEVMKTAGGVHDKTVKLTIISIGAVTLIIIIFIIVRAVSNRSNSSGGYGYPSYYPPPSQQGGSGGGGSSGSSFNPLALVFPGLLFGR